MVVFFAAGFGAATVAGSTFAGVTTRLFLKTITSAIFKGRR
jgi:hypothetical protein